MSRSHICFCSKGQRLTPGSSWRGLPSGGWSSSSGSQELTVGVGTQWDAVPVVRHEPHWEYLHHRNQQRLYIRACVFGEPVVKDLLAQWTPELVRDRV